MLNVFYCLVNGVLLLKGIWCVPVVHLENESDDYSYSAMYGQSIKLPNITWMSFCVRTKIYYSTWGFTVLSFARGDQEIYFTLEKPEQVLRFTCCGFNYAALPFPVRQNIWQHWCFSFNPDNSTTRLGINGKVTELSGMVPAKELITEDADLAVGRVNHGRGGITFGSSDLIADLADLRLYDMDLTTDDMIQYMNCFTSDLSLEPILTLDSGHLEPRGLAVLNNISKEEVCEKPQPNVIFSTTKLNFRQAYKWCSDLGGSITLPENELSDQMIFNLLQKSTYECFDGPRGLFYWLGAIGNVSLGKWIRLSSNTPITNDYLIPHNKPSQDQNCLGLMVVSNRDYITWYPTDCENKLCVSCYFDSYQKFSLRGLCINSKFETELYMAGYKNGSIHYRGRGHTSLELVGDKWILESRLHQAIATMVSIGIHDTPLGRHKWKLIGDKCSFSTASLVLTGCDEDQFTCDDGLCIDEAMRCDLLLDCPDHSDENNCDILVYSPEYSRSIPPSGKLGLLQLYVSMSIASAREFNLESFTITIDTTFYIRWRDPRLRFKNLQELLMANSLNESMVWLPQISLIDGWLGPVDLSHKHSSLWVLLESDPLSPSESGINDYEEKLYSGAENSIQLNEKQIITFRCHFGLEMYPFDTQRCSIILDVINLDSRFGSLFMDDPGVIFEGQRNLLEYQLVSEIMKPYIFNNRTMIQVELSFQNLYSYYIGNVFVPNLMMVMICYLTLFFTINDFSNRIMVSLTSLLVLAGLFAQTSASIPKTSYLKLIDGWYLALISMDFFVIVTLVKVESLRQKYVFHESNMEPNVRQISPAKKLNTFAQRIFFLILAMLLAIFLGLANLR